MIPDQTVSRWGLSDILRGLSSQAHAWRHQGTALYHGTVNISCVTFVQAIFNMVGPSLTNIDPNDTPDRRTQEIFDKMDENHDGVLTKEEFVKGCMADEFLYQILTADTSGSAP